MFIYASHTTSFLEFTATSRKLNIISEHFNVSLYKLKSTVVSVLKSGASTRSVLKSGASRMPVLKSGAGRMPVLKSGACRRPVLKSGASRSPVLKSGASRRPVAKSGASRRPSVGGGRSGGGARVRWSRPGAGGSLTWLGERGVSAASGSRMGRLPSSLT